MHSGRRTTYVVVKIATIPLLHHSTAVQPYLHEEFLPNLRRTDEESLRLSPRGQKPLFQPQQQIQKLHCRVVYCQSCFFKAQVFTFFLNASPIDHFALRWMIDHPGRTFASACFSLAPGGALGKWSKCRMVDVQLFSFCHIFMLVRWWDSAGFWWFLGEFLLMFLIFCSP